MKQSYGNASKKRVKRVLEAILVFSTEYEYGSDWLEIQTKVEAYKGKKDTQLFLKTTTKDLIKLVKSYEMYKGLEKNIDLKSWEIRDVLKHLENTLKILQDLRKKRQGSSEIWIMLTIWHNLCFIDLNLAEINNRWQKPSDRHQNNILINRNNQYNNLLTVYPNKVYFGDKKICVKKFIGRKWLFEEIYNQLEKSNTKAILITSEPGVGKTSFLQEFLKREKDNSVLAYYSCQRDIKYTLKTSTFILNLVKQISENHEGYSSYISKNININIFNEEKCEKDPIHTLIEGLIIPLSNIDNKKSKFYILIDAIDETLTRINSSHGKSLIYTLQQYIESFPDWIQFIITSRRIPSILSSFGKFNQIKINTQDKRNLNDISTYLDSQLFEISQSADTIHTDKSLKKVKNQIYELSQGNFLYAQQAFDGLRKNLYTISEIGKLPPGLHSLYLEYFSNIFQDPKDFEETKQLLQVLFASAEPLNKSQIRKICKFESEEYLEKILQGIHEYIYSVKGEGNNTYIRIFHHSMMDWFTGFDAMGTLFYVSIQKGHEYIADWCIETLDNNQWQRDTEYVELYTPHHLINAGYGNKLIELFQKHPIYIQISVKSIMDSCIQEQDWPIHNISDFLYKLVRTNEHIAVSIVLDLAQNLLEKKYNLIAQEIINLIPPNAIYFNVIHIVFQSKKYLLEEKFLHANQLLLKVVDNHNIPYSISGIAGLNLIETNKSLGNIEIARKIALSLEELLNPKFDYDFWMRLQLEIAELEYYEGDLPNSWFRLITLYNCASSKKANRFYSVIFRLKGNIQLSLCNYSQAKKNYLISIEESSIENWSLQSNYSKICLAEMEISLSLHDVEDLLEEEATLIEDKSSFLAGRMYLAKSKYKLAKHNLNEALQDANSAANIFSRLHTRIWSAQCKLLTSIILYGLERYEEACLYSFQANYVFQQQQIFPSLRVEAYNYMINSAKILGKEDQYIMSDNPSLIRNIEYFDHMTSDFSLYCQNTDFINAEQWQF